VIVEHGGGGGATAAPIARRVLDAHLARSHLVGSERVTDGL
jgi:hypothetical protein